MNKTFLLTGSTGFIGSVLLRRLVNNKKRVHIIIRKNSNTWRVNDILKKTIVHYSDLSDIDSLKNIIKKINPNIIYHLATFGAYSYQNEADKIISTNILGTFNLLKAASDVNYELFVNTGTSSEYGFKKHPMKETDTLAPASYYAVAKSAQTLLATYMAKEEGRPIVTLRPFSVYGPYEEPKRLIPTLMKALYTQGQINLVSPKVARDFVYVEDVVDAYLKIDLLKKSTGESFNIGTGIQTTIKQIVSRATKVTGQKADLKWKSMKNRAWDTECWVADISKAKKMLKWQPKIDLEEGLKLTFDWFKKYNKK